MGLIALENGGPPIDDGSAKVKLLGGVKVDDGRLGNAGREVGGCWYVKSQELVCCKLKAALGICGLKAVEAGG